MNRTPLSASWDDLRVFLAVSTAGSQAGAGRCRGLSQAPVWRRITALERALYTQLFERTPAGYVLGAAGSALVKALDGVQRTIEIAGQGLAKAPEGAEGEVRITAPEFPGELLAGGLARLGR